MIKHILSSPIHQGILALGLIVISLILFRIYSKPIAGWNSTAIIILLYCLVSATGGIFTVGIWMYLLKSALVFFMLIAIGVILSSVLSGMSYADFGENAMVFLAPIIFYPILLIIMGIGRLIIYFL